MLCTGARPKANTQCGNGECQTMNQYIPHSCDTFSRTSIMDRTGFVKDLGKKPTAADAIISKVGNISMFSQWRNCKCQIHEYHGIGSSFIRIETQNHYCIEKFMKPPTQLRTSAGTPKGSKDGLVGLAPKLRE